jgi:hypothetical protein
VLRRRSVKPSALLGGRDGRQVLSEFARDLPGPLKRPQRRVEASARWMMRGARTGYRRFAASVRSCPIRAQVSPSLLVVPVQVTMDLFPEKRMIHYSLAA